MKKLDTIAAPTAGARLRPIKIAAELYESRGWDLEVTLTAYLRSDECYVFHGPNWFMLGSAVLIEEGKHAGSPAWFIDVAVGDIGALMRLMPFYLPFVAFHRGGGGRLRVYATEKFQRMTKK